METEEERMEPAGVGVFFFSFSFSRGWWVVRCESSKKMSLLGGEVVGSESSRASGAGGEGWGRRGGGGVGVGMNKEA